MTTIVVHGTLAKGSTWYASSWGGGGFCRALADGMAEFGMKHDIWLVNERPVGTYEALNPEKKWHLWTGTSNVLPTVEGRYEWTGSPEGLARGAAAKWFAVYLNRLRSLTSEPLRIVAHSHGCNVVKLASMLPELDAAVVVESAVFLACPHFWEEHPVFEESLSWLERADIRKQKPVRFDRKFRYRANPKVFGRILNLYSSRDAVQKTLAEKLSGTYAPQTGTLFENLKHSFGTLDIYERPQGTRVDEDPATRHLYEDLEVPVDRACGGVETHSVLHGAVVGRMAGRWIASGKSIGQLGSWPEIACGDTGG